MWSFTNMLKTFFFLMAIKLKSVSTADIVAAEENNSQCMVKHDLSQCYSIDHDKFHENDTAAVCDYDVNNNNTDICQKTYNISYIQSEPYNFFLIDFVLRACCGPCLRYRVINTFEYISQISHASIASSHFVFPVLGPSDATRLHGHHFMPLLDPPVLFYIKAKDNSSMVHLLSSCLHMWPLIVVCLLLASLSGFICWAMETWNNRDEFPRSFLVGWLEGFWWSFITMTTVGYGDKAPRSIIARIFSVLWILVGITAFSIITATLSSELTKVNHPRPHVLMRARVGALKHRVYDAAVIGKYGGTLVEIDSHNETVAVFELIRSLRKKEIDGFIIDCHTYAKFFLSFNTHDKASLVGDNNTYASDIEFLEQGTTHTEKKYGGGKLSLGVLVHEKSDYDYFANFVADNKLVMKTCAKLFLNNFTHHHADLKQKEDLIFSIFHGMFWPTLITVMSAISGIICFGVIYEWHRRKYTNAVDTSYASDRMNDLMTQ